jgi:hypothetical protein
MTERDRLLMLFDAAMKAGVPRACLRDAISRGLEYFGTGQFDAYEAARWGEDLHAEAPHLFPAEAKLGPTEVQIEAVQKIESPTERITAYRELQKAKK